MKPSGLIRKPDALVSKILDKATAHHSAGRLQDAACQYRRCLDLEPGHAAAHYNLGVIATLLRDHARAVFHHTEALRAAPDMPARWVALAGALLASDRVNDARAILERFLTYGFPKEIVSRECRPLVMMLGANARIAFDSKQFEETERLLELLILLDADNAAAVHLAGLVALRTGRVQHAVDLLTIAVYRDGTNATYFADLGLAFRDSGNLVAAGSAFEKALELDSALDKTRVDLADLYQVTGRLQNAAACWLELIARVPGSAEMHNNLGAVLHRLGRTEAAVAAFEKALALNPAAAFAHGNLVYTRLYVECGSAEDFAEMAKSYGRRHADALRRLRPFANDPSPDRRLNIGFVSADFRDHPVVRFLEPFLIHADRERFDFFAYSNASCDDAVTETLKAHFKTWRPIDRLDDEAAADLIESDRIDILVDLSGHSGGNRLSVFARKPAPVQVTWIGLPATTGLAAIDYRLTDAIYDPVGETEHLHSEMLWRIAGTGICYQPFLPAPDVAETAPFVENRYVTFGCFNRFEKLTDDALTAWGAILAAVPDARLMLIIADIDDPRTRGDAEARLTTCGLPLDRIAFAPRNTTNRYAMHRSVDIALDPFPFNGNTTTFDTLYMGVPVVTLAGPRTVARVGAAILGLIGLSELIARDVDGYVAIARRLAGDPDQLLRMRSGLRERLIASPHMDHVGHAREVGTALTGMWRLWCAESTSREVFAGMHEDAQSAD
ncbi:tetratricopeptide repeat protein [Methylobacterium sp. J-030]|uniref:O-linked N-acetylglucosamine transferase family protein n=1 Tax=Methylobacterium sp. J-030 TaxID=2836627 RepID=UPI001FBA8C99|nr:tetratricopeptide repeat protein [Methylobacterium sp. J-030]MCJ2072259.1 tetratricopeptide repeat protein [Methylobacterium sp. J-030]